MTKLNLNKEEFVTVVGEQQNLDATQKEIWTSIYDIISKQLIVLDRKALCEWQARYKAKVQSEICYIDVKEILGK